LFTQQQLKDNSRQVSIVHCSLLFPLSSGSTFIVHKHNAKL
jgi:hypothetical protein